MFRDDKQLSRACQAICACCCLNSLWTEFGPTEQAKKLLRANGGPMSSGERVMFLCAWAIWNGCSSRIPLICIDLRYRNPPIRDSLSREGFLA